MFDDSIRNKSVRACRHRRRYRPDGSYRARILRYHRRPQWREQDDVHEKGQGFEIYHSYRL